MKSTTLDEHIGARIRQIRRERGLSGEEFGAQVREYVGTGWDKPSVSRVEQGKKPVSASDLVAVSLVLGCTIADLTGTTEPVSLGAKAVPRTDAIVGGEDAMPEVEGMARFRDAAEALADVSHAWERYAHLIDVARRRVGEVPAVRRQVERYRDKVLREAVREMESAFGYREPVDGWEGAEAAARRNPSPAMLAAVDALDTYPIPENGWQQRRISRGRSKR